MDETEKAINLLIHDVRAPLSVAQGYIRLLQQNRLSAESERQRALAQTLDALGRISRLCDDAAAFVAEPVAAAGAPSTLQALKLVEQVREACAARGVVLVFLSEGEKLSSAVRLFQPDSVVQSLAVILGAARKATRDDSVRVSVQSEEKEVRFLLGCDEDRAALMSSDPETLDPWRGGHGIALPLACRAVTEAGGRVWTCADRRAAVGIALPEEASAP